MAGNVVRQQADKQQLVALQQQQQLQQQLKQQQEQRLKIIERLDIYALINARCGLLATYPGHASTDYYAAIRLVKSGDVDIMKKVCEHGGYMASLCLDPASASGSTSALMNNNSHSNNNTSFSLSNASLSSPVRELIDAMLLFNFAQHIKHDDEVLFGLFESFLRNVGSANPSFVEDIYKAILLAAKIVDPCSKVGVRMTRLLNEILAAYPVSASLLCHTITLRFPHFLRDTRPFITYLQFLFHFYITCPNTLLAQRIVSCVTEQIVLMDVHVDHRKKKADELKQESVVEPMFDMDLVKRVDDATLLDKLDQTLTQVYLFLDAIASGDQSDYMRLDPEETMRNVSVMGVNAYYDTICTRSSKGADYVSCLENFVYAFEEHVIRLGNLHYSGFPVLYATSLRNRFSMVFLDRLKTLFMDYSLDRATRIAAIRFATAFVTLSKSVQTYQVIEWLHAMAKWEHTYLENQAESNLAIVDAELHELFYTCFQGIMIAVVGRQEDIFKAGTYHDSLRKMRLASLIRAPLNPLIIVRTPELGSRFASLLAYHDILDCSDVLANNAYVGIASLTKRSRRRNVIRMNFPYHIYMLPLSLALCQTQVRIDRTFDRSSQPHVEEQASGAIHTESEMLSRDNDDDDADADNDNGDNEDNNDTANNEPEAEQGVPSGMMIQSNQDEGSAEMDQLTKPQSFSMGISWDQSPAPLGIMSSDKTMRL